MLRLTPENTHDQTVAGWRIDVDRDARFHSGNPVTAEDVAWSLYRVLKLNYGLATTWKAYGWWRPATPAGDG